MQTFEGAKVFADSRRKSLQTLAIITLQTLLGRVILPILERTLKNPIFLKTYLGECMRLGDVIEKTQSELNTSKIQLSQIQRQEAQSRQELDSIRSLTNNKDKRGKELQV